METGGPPPPGLRSRGARRKPRAAGLPFRPRPARAERSKLAVAVRCLTPLSLMTRRASPAAKCAPLRGAAVAVVVCRSFRIPKSAFRIHRIALLIHMARRRWVEKSDQVPVKKRAFARISIKSDKKRVRFALPILTFRGRIAPHGPETTIRNQKRPDFGNPRNRVFAEYRWEGPFRRPLSRRRHVAGRPPNTLQWGAGHPPRAGRNVAATSGRRLNGRVAVPVVRGRVSESCTPPSCRPSSPSRPGA